MAPAAPEERQGGDLEADGGAGGLLDGFGGRRVVHIDRLGVRRGVLRPSTSHRDTPASRRYHTKLSEEERKDKCAPCRAALLTVTNRDSTMMDEAEQALGLKASKD